MPISLFFHWHKGFRPILYIPITSPAINHFFKELIQVHSLVAQLVKNPPAKAGDATDKGSIPGSERSPGEGNGNLLQYCCLEICMDRGERQAAVHEVAKSRTQVNTHARTVESGIQKPFWVGGMIIATGILLLQAFCIHIIYLSIYLSSIYHLISILILIISVPCHRIPSCHLSIFITSLSHSKKPTSIIYNIYIYFLNLRIHINCQPNYYEKYISLESDIRLQFFLSLA